ncbi:MAG: DUF5063 domain-containing protein [Bacteroidales bacterium]|nr:DUF5063 domain-containing protein [Bacteroidales bacterium]
MTNNALAFIALCNEYCAAVEHARETEKTDLVQSLLRLLPRIYIAATDLAADLPGEAYIDGALDEDYYESVRHSLEMVLGEDDSYLEVFEEDMKYSDTPIGASLAEGLADLFQVFYNLLETVRDAPDELADEALAAVRDDFANYWGQTLCNVMRPLHHIYYQS